MTQDEEILMLAEKSKLIENLIWAEYVDESDNCEPIIDGIVNIEKFIQSKLKILWILKEPYDNEQNGIATGGGWHFANDFLAPDGFYKRMGRSRNTWHPIIYVSYGILNNFLLWDDMDYIKNNQTMADIVRNIAVINVKKLPGFKRTYDFGPIRNAYNNNKELLHKQISTYNPDIIIGGSTLNLFYNELGINKAKDEKKFGCVEYIDKNSKLYISAYHPAQTQVTRECYINDIINLVKMWSDKKASR
jgi:hypothetical protein